MLTLLEYLHKRFTSETVFNQYASKEILDNLRIYFEYLLINGADVLFVGEAPGYKGCRLTGIPFTCGAVIIEGKHAIFRSIGHKLKVHPVISETTATIVWNALNGDKKPPIFWNAFPFHPHKSGVPASNRKPTKLELEEGKEYLNRVCEIFQPSIVYAIGKVGEKILQETFPYRDIKHVRHPSRGGKTAFIAGIKEIQM